MFGLTMEMLLRHMVLSQIMGAAPQISIKDGQSLPIVLSMQHMTVVPQWRCMHQLWPNFQ